MIILRELNDPRLTGMPSITRVKVAEDLSTADVFVTIMGTAGQQTSALNALKHSAGLMRGRLTKQMTLRIAPFLNFKLDEDLKKELELEAVLRKVELENQELDRKRAEEAAAQAAAEAPAASPADSPADAGALPAEGTAAEDPGGAAAGSPTPGGGEGSAVQG